jgi:hypothetical protein
MDDIFSKAIDFLRDSTVHFSYRVALGILIVLGLLLFNDIFGWTRYHTVDAELQEILMIKEIDSNVLNNDTAINRKFRYLKDAVVHNRSYTSVLISNVKKLISPNEKLVGKQGSPSSTIKESRDKSSVAIDWLTISAMWLTYLLIVIIAIAMLYEAFFVDESTQQRVTTIVGMSLFIPFVYFIGKVYSFLISLLPVFEHIWINYSVNALGQIVLIIVCVRLARKRKNN